MPCIFDDPRFVALIKFPFLLRIVGRPPNQLKDPNNILLHYNMHYPVYFTTLYSIRKDYMVALIFTQQ